MQSKDNKEFAWNVHQYLREQLQFGDTKAAVLCGFTGVLAVSMLKTPKFQEELGTSLLAAFSLLSILLFSLAFIFALSCIWPSLGTTKTRKVSNPFSLDKKESTEFQQGFLYWKNILAHTNHNTFAKELSSLDDTTREVSQHCYELASILEKKYKKLHRAFCLFFFGLFFAMLFVLSAKGDVF